MKKTAGGSILLFLTVLLSAFCLASCAVTGADRPAASDSEGPAFDIDLTSMSSTMVYSQVYDMITSPDRYLGKTVKMKGTFTYAEGDGRYYFACVIADATACCSQGIEFVLKDGRRFPDEYPQPGQDITVGGTFRTYTEGEYLYCELADAELIRT